MTVSLGGNLPKDDKNGLANAERRLLTERHDGVRYLVVGVLEVQAAKEKAPDWTLEPTVALTHVEIADGPAADTAAKLLLGLYQKRTGKVELDLDGTGEQPQQPLALIATGDPKFVVKSADDGYSIELLTAEDQVVGGRYALKGPEFADLDFAVGAFKLEQLPIALLPYAKTLLAEWGIDADEPVDAEVVDDEDGEAA